ncbi:MAG: hypothetical protein ACLP4V_32405 [Methylocella sp.]
MRTKSMQRAERAATALVNGEAILGTLKAQRPRLIAAAKQSRPPVAAVSEALLEEHGEEIKKTPVRQFVGLAVRAILEEAGYEVAYTGVRINGDPVFRTGSVYRLRTNEDEAPEVDDALDRMMKSLTTDQAQRAFRALLLYFPDLRDQAAGETARKRSKTARSRSTIGR